MRRTSCARGRRWAPTAPDALFSLLDLEASRLRRTPTSARAASCSGRRRSSRRCSRPSSPPARRRRRSRSARCRTSTRCCSGRGARTRSIAGSETASARSIFAARSDYVSGSAAGRRDRPAASAAVEARAATPRHGAPSCSTRPAARSTGCRTAATAFVHRACLVLLPVRRRVERGERRRWRAAQPRRWLRGDVRRDATLRVGPGVPELHRPRAAALGPRLLRIELRAAAPHEAPATTRATSSTSRRASCPRCTERGPPTVTACTSPSGRSRPRGCCSAPS